MVTTNNNAAPRNRTASTPRANYTQTIASVQRATWLLSYRIEEARQHHAVAKHSLRNIGCCIALAMLQFMGGRV